jgi:hypothetical protein
MKNLENRLTKVEIIIRNLLNPTKNFFRIFVLEKGIKRLVKEYQISNKNNRNNKDINFIYNKRILGDEKQFRKAPEA